MNPFAPQKKDETAAFLDARPELQPGEAFHFACHPDIRCFNACCSALRLVLMPYDVLRLRRALGLSGQAFAQRHAQVDQDPQTGWPLFFLKMKEDRIESCPFAVKEGCSVYPHRPSACRSYPLGRATRLDDDGGLAVRYFVMREAHCAGFEEPTSFTPESWMENQGLTDYIERNDPVLRLLAELQRREVKLTPKQATTAIMALYSPEDFANMVTTAGLLGKLTLAPEVYHGPPSSPEEWLAFGVDWLSLLLLGESRGLARARP